MPSTTLDLWGSKMQKLFLDGFEHSGTTWRVAVLGVTGDAPFLKAVGNFTRSFNNVRKTHTSANPQRGICWLCLAGRETPEEAYPFEDLGFSGDWIETRGRELPWAEPGPLLRWFMLPRDPATFFRPDFFHVYYAGVGKDFVASALVYMLKGLYGQGSVAKNLAAMNADLKKYLRMTKAKLHCGSLTADLLGYSSTRDYPKGRWSKSMDTAVLTKFVVVLLSQHAWETTVSHCNLLKEILESAYSIGRVIRTCLGGTFFLTAAESLEVVSQGHRFLKGYAALARQAYDRQLCLFKFMPVTHLLNEMILTARDQYLLCGTAVNPAAESTFMSEDFVGNTARLSRRVSPMAVAQKTLQRYCVFARQQLDAAESLSLARLFLLD